MIIEVGNARVIINQLATGETALTLSSHGGGVTVILSGEKVEEVAREIGRGKGVTR